MIHDIGAKEIPLTDREVYDSQRLDIYIGVFFDGTNNNKVQSMIGQYFRRKEFFEKKAFDKLKGKVIRFNVKDYNTEKEITKEVEITDFDSFIKSGITKDACKSILGFTDSDCDKIFGTSTAITNDLEKKIIEVDNSVNSYRWSSAAIGYSEGWNDLLDNHVNKSDVINHALYWCNIMFKHQIRKRLEYISGIKSKNESCIPEWTIKGAWSKDSYYTNPAILESLYKVNDKGDAEREENKIKRYSIYVEGSGADNIIIGGGNKIKSVFTDTLGLAAGYGKTGVFAKCRKAVEKINDIANKYKDKKICLHFDVFGFSRGATTSRIFTYLVNLVNPNDKEGIKGALSKSHKEMEIKYNDYLLYSGDFEPKYFLSKKVEKEVRLLGLYDTVSSIGVLEKNKIMYEGIKHLDSSENLENYGKNITHEMNVNDYGLWATTEAKHVIHFCALDEYRENFALVDIESSITSNGLEIFMPGCHTDIGGGTDLGLDEKSLKIINKGNFFNCDYPYKALNDRNLLPIEVSSFMDLGWIPQKHIISEKNETLPAGRAPNFRLDMGKTIVIDGTMIPNYDVERYHYYGYVGEQDPSVELDNIGLYKYVTPGYSNVTLKLMRDWALGKLGEKGSNTFAEIPEDFPIPDDLKSFYEGIKKCLNNSGRYFCVPPQEQYKKLRCKYLHFSINEGWFKENFMPWNFDFGGNKLVNGPELVDFNKKKVIARRIYKGVQNNDKYEYMHDFKGKGSEIDCTISITDNNDYYYLYMSKKADSMDYMSSKEKQELHEKMEKSANFVPPLTDSKPQISLGMYSKSVRDTPYIDENSNFHISKTENYTEYPKDIDQIRPRMFKLPAEDKSNK